ncbi:hypothetical protein EV1_003540 [Malus domestica]
MGMANLSSLVHELRERIAAPSTPPNNHYDDDLVIRFRAVLPDLLHSSVVPSPSGICPEFSTMERPPQFFLCSVSSCLSSQSPRFVLGME